MKLEKPTQASLDELLKNVVRILGAERVPKLDFPQILCALGPGTAKIEKIIGDDNEMYFRHGPYLWNPRVQAEWQSQETVDMLNYILSKQK